MGLIMRKDLKDAMKWSVAKEEGLEFKENGDQIELHHKGEVIQRFKNDESLASMMIYAVCVAKSEVSSRLREYLKNHKE